MSRKTPLAARMALSQPGVASNAVSPLAKAGNVTWTVRGFIVWLRRDGDTRVTKPVRRSQSHSVIARGLTWMPRLFRACRWPLVSRR
eukprot:5757543-Prymnesium_polylepis.1